MLINILYIQAEVRKQIESLTACIRRNAIVVKLIGHRVGAHCSDGMSEFNGVVIERTL